MLLTASSLAGAVAAGEVEAVQERNRLVMLCWPHQESIFVRRMVREHGREGLNRFTGIDVDLMSAFAERLGVELVVRPVTPDFGALIPSLLAGEGDVVASSMSITAERSRKVEFSAPYFQVGKAVVTRRGSAIATVGDLPGRIAAVARGTSHEEHLLALPGVSLRPVQFMLDNYRSVIEGEADFTLVDSSSAERVLDQYADLAAGLEIAFMFPEADNFGFAVAPGSELRRELDRFVDELRRSGELERIVARHAPDD